MNVIIDYGLGNIRSLVNWFNRGGVGVQVSGDPEVIKDAELLILPGVGAYRDAMNALVSKGYDALIKKHVLEGKPIVGICLGMQLLYEKSLEGGNYTGLGLLSGQVIPFNEQKVKVPHMGWNNLITRPECDFLKGQYVYFVHSYYVQSSGDEVIASAEYDVNVAGVVRQNNVLGFQFHPEKSGDVGPIILDYLKEFTSEYISSN